MKKDSTLKDKLKTYSALTGALVGVSSVANAQWMYTDVSPDYTAINNQDSFNLDLNNDATIDFVIKNFEIISSSVPFNYFIMMIQGTGAIAGPISTVFAGWPMASALNGGAPINATLPWNNISVNSGYNIGAVFAGPPYNITEGLWAAVPADRYMPFRINIAAVDHYGWARMTSSVGAAGSTFTIKDYAYNAGTANVFAGVNEMMPANTDLQVYSYNNIAHVNFQNNYTPDNAKVVITDLLGKQVSTTIVNKSKNEISLADLNAGVYFVAVQEDKFTTTVKVTVQ